ncbi:MAG TPA: ABC transporter substrate-binding protein [Dehalococcoidia bacterium]|nr:ABC transporter substrate-binding protein [Dehalococcoidia bacterium]
MITRFLLARRALLLAMSAAAALTLACGSGPNKPSSTPPGLDAQSTPKPAAPSAGTAATSTPTPTAATFPITVHASDGKDFVIKAPPKRIASLSAGTTEILYAIGAGAQVVATDKYSNYPAAAQNTPKLDGFNPSAEAIAGVQPDLVLLTDDPKQIEETLNGLGIPALWLSVPSSIQATLQQIQLYGDITGHSAEARRVVAGMQTRLQAVQQKLAGVPQGPRVYHELDPTLFSVAPNSFVGDLYTLLKAQNIVPAGDKPYPQVTQEFIIAQDPQVIILADEASGVTPDSVRARPGWDAISAVKNGKVYTVDPDVVSRPGPRIVDAVETLAKLLYPDRFQ